MKITDNITDLYSAMLLLEQLEDQDYLEANWISPEEVEDFKKEVQNQVADYKSQAEEYIARQLRARNESLMFVTGIDSEIARLQELKASHQKKADSVAKWVDFLMQTFKIEKLDTELNKLSYRKSEAVILTNEELIPAEYKKEKLTISIDKTEIKKAIKAGTEVPGAEIETRNNLQIK